MRLTAFWAESANPQAVFQYKSAMVSRRLVEKLICPLSGAKLVVAGNYLVSTDMVTRLKYPVVKGIPVLLSEEAVEMIEAEWLMATQKQEG